jgi:hypothetical protein
MTNVPILAGSVEERRDEIALLDGGGPELLPDLRR